MEILGLFFAKHNSRRVSKEVSEIVRDEELLSQKEENLLKSQIRDFRRLFNLFARLKQSTNTLSSTVSKSSIYDMESTLEQILALLSRIKSKTHHIGHLQDGLRKDLMHHERLVSEMEHQLENNFRKR